MDQYRLEDDNLVNNGIHPDNRSRIRDRENNELSFSGGITLSYQFTNHWALGAGLVFSNTSISIDPQNIYATRESGGTIAYKYNASTGYAYVTPGFNAQPALGDSITANDAQHTIQYFSLPVGIKYKIGMGHFFITPVLGLTANFITSAKIQTEVSDGLNAETIRINKLQGVRTFYAGVFANVEIRLQWSNRFSIDVVPAFRSAISSISSSNVVKTYPYSFGAGLGVSYRL